MIKSKMGNIKVVIDGITFASKREGRRYQELRLMERAGVIDEIRCQVKYGLIPAVYYCLEPGIIECRHGAIFSFKKECKWCRCVQREKSYIADFVYYDKQCLREIVEDVKPRNISARYRKTEVYKRFLRKKKLMKIIYNIEVREV